jgi:hypothetical protein
VTVFVVLLALNEPSYVLIYLLSRSVIYDEVLPNFFSFRSGNVLAVDKFNEEFHGQI